MKHVLLALALSSTACAVDSTPLDQLGPLTATIDVDVGIPETFKTMYWSGLSFALGQAAGCVTLDDSAHGALDGQPAGLFDPGGPTDGSKAGDGSSIYCEEPTFFVDSLPAPRDRSEIVLADDSARFAVHVDRLLVNPRLAMGDLYRGEEVVVHVDDDRPIARATMVFSPDYSQVTDSYFYADAVVSGNTLRFAVPAYASGRGPVSIEVSITEHRMECEGFASCEVLTRGGATFTRTIR